MTRDLDVQRLGAILAGVHEGHGKTMGSALDRLNPCSAHTNNVTTGEVSKPQRSHLLNRYNSSICVVMGRLKKIIYVKLLAHIKCLINIS